MSSVRRTTTWIVVPAYNEGAVIEATVRDLVATFDNVVVVDDCSVDTTAVAAQEAGAYVCRHPVNLGQGAALATGIAYALRSGATEIVTFDADGQHRTVDALMMVERLRAGGYDVVLGSRFLGSAPDMPTSRRLLLKAAVQFTRLTTGLMLTDAHNGLRALSRSAAQRIRIRHNRMAHASEVLDQIASLRLKYVEVAVQVVYTDYSKAKGQRWTGMFSILGDILVGKLYR